MPLAEVAAGPSPLPSGKPLPGEPKQLENTLPRGMLLHRGAPGGCSRRGAPGWVGRAL